MILDLIYPRRCPVCGGVLPFGESGACPDCVEALSFVRQPTCLGCGKELFRDGSGRFSEEEYCSDCLRRRRSFSGGIALLNYNDAARKVMAGLKYKNCREHADFLAEEMAKRHGRQILRLGADALVPVPVHRKRRRERGYNQAELLAGGLSRRLSIPVKKLLVRVEYTEAQKKLGYEARQRNEERAFRAFHATGIRRVLLVDDIYTTGATAEACTKALLAAGVGQVFLANMAVGISRR